MTTASLPATLDSRVARTTGRRRFHLGLAFGMTAMVVVGFWPTYFGPLTAGTYAGSWVFHLHATVYMGWMALFVAQAALVASGRTRVHRRLGTFAIAYGVLVLVVGLAVSFYAPVVHIGSGAWDLDAAASFLMLPLGDMVLFAALFAAAIVYRRQPEIHKRLMVMATVAIVFAAVSRRIPHDPAWPFLLVWLAPVFATMTDDWRTRGRVHRTYLIGLAILLLAFGRVYLRESELWLRIGRALLAPLV